MRRRSESGPSVVCFREYLQGNEAVDGLDERGKWVLEWPCPPIAMTSEWESSLQESGDIDQRFQDAPEGVDPHEELALRVSMFRAVDQKMAQLPTTCSYSYGSEHGEHEDATFNSWLFFDNELTARQVSKERDLSKHRKVHLSYNARFKFDFDPIAPLGSRLSWKFQLSLSHSAVEPLDDPPFLDHTAFHMEPDEHGETHTRSKADCSALLSGLKWI